MLVLMHLLYCLALQMFLNNSLIVLILFILITQKNIYSMHQTLKPLSGYTYGEKIGFGTYADVYKCFKTSTKEAFAVKIFKPLRHNDPTNLRKEIDIVRKLSHPNIIKCVDIFQDENNKDKLYAAVFQFCGKGNLHEYMDYQIEQKNKIPQMIAKCYIYKIIDALMHLHENKIAHRDLKLANILINEDYEIKLADFGLSKEHGDVDMFSTMCGTPLTMAPEVLSRKNYSLKCDTWSFGVISYYLMFSTYPFTGRSPDDLLNNIVAQKVPRFPKSTEVSEEAKKFLKACLTVDHENRPSIQELQCNKWFTNLAQSKIRVNYMKYSSGEDSPAITKINTVIVHAINQEIHNLIKSLNLTENHIKAVAKGFDEFYPNEKWKLFMFYFYIGRKIKTLCDGRLEVHLGEFLFKLDPKSLNALDGHINHILMTNKDKVKYLDQSINEGKQQSLQKSYQTLVKFVVKEGNKLISEDESNLKKISFFKNLLEFLNTEISEPKVKISLRRNQLSQNGQMQQEFKTYVQNMLKEGKISKLVNMQDSKTMQSSSTAKQIDLQWTITYENPLKNCNETETWRMVGEAVAGALKARESSLKEEQAQRINGK